MCSFAGDMEVCNLCTTLLSNIDRRLLQIQVKVDRRIRDRRICDIPVKSERREVCDLESLKCASA